MSNVGNLVDPALMARLLVLALLASLAVFVSIRRPPAPLWPVLLVHLVLTLCWVGGDLGRSLARDPSSAQLALSILYTGVIPLPAAIWIVALRLAEQLGRPFAWSHREWARAPVYLAGALWLLMITNPLHGQFAEPQLGTREVYLWGWYLQASAGYTTTCATIILCGLLCRRVDGARFRSQVVIVMIAAAAPLAGSLIYVSLPEAPLFNPTIAGLAVGGSLYVVGIYRGRLFALLPVALRDVIARDSDGVILIDSAGGLLFANPAAKELFPHVVLRPGSSVFSSLARVLRPADAATSRTRDTGFDASTLERDLDELAASPPEERLYLLGQRRDRWIRVTVSAIENRRGRTIARSLRLRDVTVFRLRIQMERLVSDISSRFIGFALSNLDQEIERALAEIGEITASDRCCLFQLSDDRSRAFNSHEWCAAGITSRREHRQDVKVGVLPHWTTILHRGEAVIVSHVADLPPEAEAERAIVKKADMKSLLLAPVLGVGDLAAFICLDAVRSPREWPEDLLPPLKLVGEILASAVARKRAEDALAYRSEFEHLIATVSTDFINRPPESLALGIDETLSRVGKFLDVDRVRISEFEPTLTTGRITHMWNASGEALETMPQSARHLAQEFFPWVFAHLRRFEPVAVESVADLPPEAAVEKARWMTGGTTSFLSIPLRYQGRLVGEIGANLKGRTRRWSDDELQLLDMLGQLLTVTLQRIRSEQSRGRLETQLRQAQKLEAVGTLAGGIAHDFNNLLTGILGGIEMARLALPADSPIVEDLRAAEASATSAADLTQQLLTLSRRQEPRFGPVDLNAIVTRTARLLKRSIPETITIETRLEETLSPVRGDERQLEQALLNLGINARDATLGGGTLTLAVSTLDIAAADDPPHPLSRPGRFVVITVSDSGRGIPADIIDRVFEPFFTTKEHGKGTGLGLAMVYACAEAHSGWVTVESSCDRGTDFRLHLPWIPEAAADTVAREQPLEMSRGSETVLFVDDSESVLRVGATLLERLGYGVLVARDGRDAIEMFDRHADVIALVVTDLIMPLAGGREVLSALRERGTRVPVLATSGYGYGARTEDLISAGFAGFVSKPFRAIDLAQIIRKTLDEAGGSPAAANANFRPKPTAQP